MNRASDYETGIAANPQPMTLEEAAWITPPTQLTDTEAMLDMPRLRRYRQERLREQIKLHNLGGVLLTDPLSIRYATGVRNCALFQTHIHAGYLFVPAEGPVVYFDSSPGRYTGSQLETIDVIRDDLLPVSYMFAGSRHEEWCRKWALQIKELMDQYGGGNPRIGLEKAGTEGTIAFQSVGLEVLDAGAPLAMARKIKSAEEILCMNQTIAVAEDGMTRMRNALVNGITEVQLWSHMWQANIEGGGEWIEYRLLASGERTNPWQQEAGSRMIRAGDLVCFDCGMIGPFGYGADISRAFHCGPGKPTDHQRMLYTQAWEEIQHNTELMQPGADFNDIIANRYIQPEAIGQQTYPALCHGLGMGDEWPVVYYPADEQFHFDGQLEAGMVICVESYVGEIGGNEGIKLENQVLVTESGPITLSRYPFEDGLLNREF
ncbi:M24 family metallopeptidase [Aliamphritea spongicola]|uniref:M24 family metallopeptidase n=1 Tax=Aliamphritea spongicola TaxID=707589 RepID=UPI00196B457D|nr:Xaa-Pro peptidase family protein [Aliamphritea spongicola]MBN3563792.1 aminopeptidase P family protein [Aliamphritea spongicola]